MNIIRTPKNDRFSWVDEVTAKDYEDVLNAFEQGICVVSASGRIVYINRAYEEIFNMSDFIVRGRSIFNTVKDEMLLKAYKNRKKYTGIVNYDGRKDGVFGMAFPFFKDNEYQGVVGLYTLDSKSIKRETAVLRVNDKKELTNPFDNVIGQSRSLVEQMNIAYKVAKTNSTVLIRGESGTGKEVVARAIHKYGNRNDKPFVAVNCGAIPINLIESELFGYEKGAFTGANHQRIGKFELAHGGTLFLDEIGDLPLEVQVKLLRVIQEKEFERIGGNESINVDVRIVAATHKNLEKMIDEGEFREDLYYRINIIPIELDALRERKEDIPLLVDYFLEKTKNRLCVDELDIDSKAMEALMQYDWPGNVRELENILERMAILSEDSIIGFADVPSHIANVYRYNPKTTDYSGLINMSSSGEIATMEEYECEVIMRAMKKYKSFNAAGKALGITHKTVASKVRKYGIEY
jgi:transcriptional regulator with PAS, ATPase and Fis domain